MEAASVDGGCWPGLRPDRLRRDRRGLAPRRPQWLHRHNASGDIVLVLIDDNRSARSASGPGRGRPGAAYRQADRGRRQANLLRHQFLRSASDRADDRAFAEALRRSGRVTLFTRSKSGTRGSTAAIARSAGPCRLLANAKLAIGSVYYNYQNAVVAASVLGASRATGRSRPSRSAIANVAELRDTQFRVDYSVDPATIPAYPAADVLTGTRRSKAARGQASRDRHRQRRHRRCLLRARVRPKLSAPMSTRSAPKRCKAGTPIDLGWFLAFALAARGWLPSRSRRNRLHGSSDHSRREWRGSCCRFLSRSRPTSSSSTSRQRSSCCWSSGPCSGGAATARAASSTLFPTSRTSTRCGATETGATRRSSPPASSITKRSSRLCRRTGAPADRADRRTAQRRRTRAHALPRRWRNFRLVRGSHGSPSATISTRSIPCSAIRPGSRAFRST